MTPESLVQRIADEVFKRMSDWMFVDERSAAISGPRARDEIESAIRAALAAQAECICNSIDERARCAVSCDVKAAPIAPSGEAVGQWQHIANEWADMATNGLQWLRNLKDGIGTVEEALANMEDNLAHCRAVPRPAHPAPSPAEPAVPLRAVLAFVDAIAINDKGLRCEYVESRSGSMVKVPDFHALAALLPAAPGEKT